MTFLAQETGQEAGEPIELYTFSRGADISRFTSGDTDITFESNVYTAIPITRNATEQDSEGDVNRLKITVPRDFAIALNFRIFVPADTYSIKIQRIHESDAGLEPFTYWAGRMRSVTWKKNIAELDCEPLTAALSRSLPRFTYQTICNHMLFDSNCKVNRASFIRTATVTGINGDEIELNAAQMSLPGSTPGLFNYWLNGFIIKDDNDFRAVQQQFTSNRFRVLLPFEDLAVGDSVQIVPGCNHSTGHCRIKFNNIINYGGYNFVPTENPFRWGVD